MASPLNVGRNSHLRPGEGKLLSAASDIGIYAGAYYDGSIYASGQSNKDYLYYTLKVDPGNFSYEVLAQVDCFVRDMAFDYTTGTMFAVLSDDRNTGRLGADGSEDRPVYGGGRYRL